MRFAPACFAGALARFAAGLAAGVFLVDGFAGAFAPPVATCDSSPSSVSPSSPSSRGSSTEPTGALNLMSFETASSLCVLLNSRVKADFASVAMAPA